MQQIAEFEQTYMNPSHNMKYYRNALPTPPLTTPILPFIPLFLKVVYLEWSDYVLVCWGYCVLVESSLLRATGVRL